MRDDATKKQRPAVAITGIGLTTPLGSTFWTSAAAGLRKQTRWQEHETILVTDDQTGVTLRGATVSRVPKNQLDHLLDGQARAAALLAPAVQELFASPTAKDVRYPKCSIHSFLGGSMLEAAEHAARTPLLFHEDSGAAERGRCHFFEELMQAAERLLKRKSRWEIVGCVDSLCSVGRLRSLMIEGRLVSGRNAEGIVAGEAAGVFLLEHEDEARKRNAPVWATITGWGRASEANTLAPATGTALTEAFRQAFATQNGEAARVSAIVADLNGERERALDWAYTHGRICSELGNEPALLHPADVTGDCGNAMGAIVLSAAIMRLALHPGAPAVAACTSDDDGSRRVILLERGQAISRTDVVTQLRNHNGEK